jgi:mannose-6-phosphate isomerase-like protein (cupin superfamily)
MDTLRKNPALPSAMIAVFAFVLMLPARAMAQAQAAADNTPVMLPDHHYDLPGVLITAADQQAHLKKMLDAKLEDIPMNMVKSGGAGDKHQYGVSIVYREKGPRPPQYAVHDDVAEVYVVLQGKGHMKVGGKIVDWKRRPVSAGNGRGSAGTKAEGAADFTIAKGDILIVPAGTPHMWVSSDEFTAYIVVRMDPDGVAPLLELGKAEYKPSIQR